MPNKKLPSYGECEYSVFISYAHADNEANNDWVGALKDAIWKRLKRLPKEVQRLTIHLSELDGPTGGLLDEELQQRIARSFGMLLVVGEKYQDANWCERELQMFSDLFGEEGCRKRLLIAAMSEEAIKLAEAGSVWREKLGEDQVWVRMFHTDAPNKPLAPRIAPDVFGQEFWDQTVKLADRLIDEIEADYKRRVDAVVAPGAAGSPDINTPWSNTKHEQLQVAIAPCTKLLQPRAELLVNAIESAGAQVTVLDRSLIDDYVPETGYPLRQRLAAFDVLVAPISNETPMRSDRDGGHAVILQEEWNRVKRGPGVVWYRPADINVAAEQTGASRHLAVIAALSPVCASEQAVLNLLFGVNAGTALRLYIEKPKNEQYYVGITRELEKFWKRLGAKEARPGLRFRLLDLSKLDTADKDVHGIVLLYPLGVKTEGSLASQQKLTMDLFPAEGATYPGCVAVIFTPPPQEVPLHDWPTVHFGYCADEHKLVMEPESSGWLSVFLNEVWERYQKRMHH
jgi:hypothetical protein